MPAVEVSELVVRYGTKTAVDRLSLRAEPGEILAVLGPNGAGKTSTFETLEGYRRPADGRVRVLGLDPIAQRRSLMERLGVMPQRGGVHPMLGPRRALRLYASYYPHPQDPADLLETLALSSVAETPWRNLSGGEQQRLSLALALVGRPDVALLDEPTAGIDPEGRAVVRAVIAGLAERGTCVLLATHELGEAERLADRVVIVRAGGVVAEGSVAELVAAAGGVLRFVAPPGLDTDGLGAALGASVSEQGAGHYRVDGEATPQRTAALASWLAAHDAALSDLRTGHSLEELYLATVGEEPVVMDTGASGGRPGRRRAR